MQVALDFLNRQINQHTSNLGGVVFSSHFLHILKDEFSDLGLVVGVSLRDSRCNHKSFLGVILLKCELGSTWGATSHCYSKLLLRHWGHLAWLCHGEGHSLLMLGEATWNLLGHLVKTTWELVVVVLLSVVVLLRGTSGLVLAGASLST